MGQGLYYIHINPKPIFCGSTWEGAFSSQQLLHEQHDMWNEGLFTMYPGQPRRFDKQAERKMLKILWA